ncbi:monosaccharide transporter [Basidiobolus meristosporus CBS 931.73]|uniref:Monosaccharide transporter n=1 Tax=Basidiobolus meristosporus CBS 931.73 TaxID=1314790 RepID=A0A1Y1XEK2_9FUNG|nr:monosaccharide transporter [Basidiobolus meristosporus CBS 931.73]|eukprot:ORX84201.1 monosaccharide transporter [Basidiobolus meristosporus CBS 931.73]
MSEPYQSTVHPQTTAQADYPRDPLRSTGEVKVTSPRDSLNASYTAYSIFCVAIACLVAFNNGWNTSVTNIPEDAIRNCPNPEVKDRGFYPCFPMGSWLWGFAVGSYALGGAVGGLSAGWFQTRFGRRNSLLFNNVNFIIGAILLGFSVHRAMWIVGRFFTGIGSGFGTVVLPTYIGESATTKSRGAMGVLNQLSVVIGILVTEAVGLGLSYHPGWRIDLAITGIIAIVQMALLPMVVETPRYYISQDKFDHAERSLVKIRKGFDTKNELREIVHAREEYKRTAGSVSTSEGIKYLFKDPLIRRNGWMCIFLCCAQQLSGINGVMYYSTTIFTDIYGKSTAQYLTVGIGGLNLLATILSVILIDRLGRKILVLTSLAGMTIFHVILLLGIQLDIPAMVIVGVFAFVLSFAIGMGPIPFLIISELIPTHAVSTVSAISLGLNWFCNFLVGFFFPSLKNVMQGYVFLIFAAICGVAFFIALIFQKETKGRSIEEITGMAARAPTGPARESQTNFAHPNRSSYLDTSTA